MPAWNKNYYDSVEFYLNEPQHIVQRSESEKRRSVRDAIKRIRRIEVSFNHVLSFFFRLAPAEFACKLLATAFPGAAPPRDLELIGREIEARFDLRNFTQPDILFVGDDALICIEMKVDAKTDVEQVFKYAALLAHLDPAGTKRRYLIYMGPKKFADLWRTKNMTIEAALTAAADLAAALPPKLASTTFMKRLANPAGVVAAMQLGYLGYGDVKRLLLDEMAQADAPDGVYKRLLEGMATEIEERGY